MSSTLPLTDNSDGTYSASFAACETAAVDVTCTWTPSGSGRTVATTVQFN